MLWKTAESNDCGRITQGAEELFVMASEAKYLQPNARVASDYYRIYHELDLSNRHAIACNRNRICCELGRSETGCYPHVLYRGCTRVQSRVGLSTPFQLSEENPKNIYILMPMYTGTRLTTAIHRRLSPRYFLRRGGLCTQATVQQILILKFAFGPEYFPGLSRNRPGPGTPLNTPEHPPDGPDARNTLSYKN